MKNVHQAHMASNSVLFVIIIILFEIQSFVVHPHKAISNKVLLGAQCRLFTQRWSLKILTETFHIFLFVIWVLNFVDACLGITPPHQSNITCITQMEIRNIGESTYFKKAVSHN